MAREETNSITHLVKIVASEVIDQKNNHLQARIDGLFKRVRMLECTPVRNQEENVHDRLGNIQSSLKNAGEYWNTSEDQLLLSEIKIALAQIAQNHGRSIGAITAWIQQEDLI